MSLRHSRPTGHSKASGAISSGDGTVRLTGTSDKSNGMAIKLAGSKVSRCQYPGCTRDHRA